MSNKKRIDISILKKQTFLILALLFIIATGSTIAYQLYLHTDQTKRNNLLGEALVIAKTITLDEVKTLTASLKDLDNAEYNSIKKHLSDLHSLKPHYRFLYLLGQKPDGSIFFFVDNESTNSKDYSPPGQNYEEASEATIDAFKTKVAVVVGPSSDRWGTWVSAYIPLIDPLTGAVIAVFGMDVDANYWTLDIFSAAAVPIGLTIIIIIAIITYLYTIFGAQSSPKPVLRRLLPTLSVALVVLLLATSFFFLKQKKSEALASIRNESISVGTQFQTAINQQSIGISAALQIITNDTKTQKALSEKNSNELLITWKPVFEDLKQNNDITHFYFLDANRNCLLRLHKPEKYGDKIDRFTAIRSEHTGKIASGVELGPLGTFTLRVIQPVFYNNKLAGYIELGKEIEEILRQIENQSGKQLAIIIHKQFLNQQGWQDGMRILGRNANWNHLTNNVISYSSYNEIPDAFLQWADTGHSEHVHDELKHIIQPDGNDAFISVFPLNNASGEEVGDLIIINNSSKFTAESNHLLKLTLILGFTILSLLFAFVYTILSRTDEGIKKQQADLKHSEELLFATLRSIGDGVITTDNKGQISFLNIIAENLTGWSNKEAAGHSISEVFRVVNAETRQNVEIPVFEAMQKNQIIGLSNHTVLIARNAREYQIADSCAPIHNTADEVIGSVLVFRDVTTEYEQRDKLHESYKMIDDLARQSRTYTWEVDHNGLYTNIGITCEDVIGYHPSEVIDKLHFYDLHPEFQRREFKEAALAVIQKRQPFSNLENLIQSKNGQIVWVLTNGIPVLNTDGTLKGYRGTDTDITVRKQTELRLLEKSEELDRYFTSSLDLLCIANSSGHFIRLNPEWERVLGYSLSELEGAKFLDFIHKDDIESTLATMARLDAQETILSFENRYRCKDGSYRWIEWRSIPQGNLIYAVARDITDRKNTQNELQNRETQLRAITESARDAILMMNSLGNITYWNPAAETILGYSRDEAVGKNLHELLTPERYLSDFHGAFPEFVKTGRGNAVGKTVELSAIRKDRTEIAISLSLSAVRLNNEWHAIGIMRDISEQKKAEGALKKAKEEAEELNFHLEKQTRFATELAAQAEMANIAKSDFLANMSHEIRTPMNGVMGMVQLLDETELSTEQHDYLNTIKASGELLLSIINDILDLSKIESGKGDPNPIEFNIKESSRDIERLFQAKLKDKQVEFIIEIDPAVPEIIAGDVRYLKQILVNLIGNSLKFTPQHGVIVLQIQLKSQDRDQARISFVISDTGIGIPEDRQAEIFKAFTQADSSVTRRFGGTGLGLTICEKLVRMLGGELKVRSQVNQGSAFYFDCPFGTVHEKDFNASAPNNDQETPSLQKPLRILVAEDNLVNQKLIKKLLEKDGHSITLAADGKQVLDLYNPNDFDLILMDIQMPVIDGTEATRRIRILDHKLNRHKVPIIALTAHALSGDREKYLDLDMDGYIPKPIDRKELKRVIAEVMTKNNEAT